MHDGRRRSARPDLHRSRRPVDLVVRWNQQWLVESYTRAELERPIERFFARANETLPMERITQMNRAEVFWLCMFRRGSDSESGIACECSPTSRAVDFIDENDNAGGLRSYGMIETSLANRYKRPC